jgi:hypothetical protein
LEAWLNEPQSRFPVVREKFPVPTKQFPVRFSKFPVLLSVGNSLKKPKPIRNFSSLYRLDRA